MATVKVYSPNPDHTGITAGVNFSGGVGEVDEARKSALTYFKRHGYKVGGEKPKLPASPPAESDDDGEPEGDLSPPPEGMPPRTGKGSGVNAWRAYAEQIGVGLDPDMDRGEIINAVDSHLAGDGEDGGDSTDDGEPAESDDDGEPEGDGE